MGYAASTEKGYYTITVKGKRILGFPEISRGKADEILASLPMEKSFHFYTDIGKPLNIHAISLQDFCDKISKIDQASIEFHFNRGDFEAWFAGLGDVELARKVTLLREKRIFGEELQKRLYEITKNRCEELNKILG
jgi:hypothetical protein